MENPFADLELAAIQIALQDQINFIKRSLIESKKDGILNDLAIKKSKALVAASETALAKTVLISGGQFTELVTGEPDKESIKKYTNEDALKNMSEIKKQKTWN